MSPESRRSVPLPARLFFTAWMAFWVPVIVVTSGPQNFWWLCNLAQFLLLIAVWTDNRLLISSQAGTVLVVGLVWTIDFIAALVLGGSPFGITSYMFNEELALIQRATSIYHIWLPIFVLWLVFRMGYERRGFWLQCAIGTLAIVGSAILGEEGRNLNARDPVGRTVLSYVAEHRNSGEYADVLRANGATA